MANNFNIVISATDRATASVKKVNDSIARLTRPFAVAQRSMNRLGQEIGRNQVVRGLANIERAAEGVFSSVARIGAPMAALIGVGSIAGITSLITGWGRLGYEIKSTSATIGVSTSELQNWRNAAQLAGLSSEEMTGGLKTFATTLQDAMYQRNGGALEMMRIIGLQLHKTSTGAIDTSRAMMDLANILNSPKLKGNAQVQGVIARTLGIEALLPLLRQGAGEILALMKEAAEVNPIKGNGAIDSAEQFAKKLAKVDLALNGMKVTIGESLLPVLSPMVERFSKFISDNRAPIGEKLSEWADRFSNWVQSGGFDKLIEDLGKVGSTVMRVVDKVDILLERFEKLGNPARFIAGGFPRMIWELATSGSPDAGGGRGSSPGNPGRTPMTYRYDDPTLDRFANDVESRLGLPKNILNAIKNYGERSNSDAVSPKGARGVMQFMPQTWAQYGKGDPSNPYASIEAGGLYMKDLLTRYHGNVTAAVTEFNGGTKQAQAVAAGGAPWVAETQHYVSRVQSGMAAMNGGKALEPQEHRFVMTLQGLPPGVTARVQDQNGTDIPVRVTMPMPTFGG